MFEIDETRYYYSARVSFKMFFVRRLCSHLRLSWIGWKKTENLIGEGGGRGCWNKNVLGGKISKN